MTFNWIDELVHWWSAFRTSAPAYLFTWWFWVVIAAGCVAIFIFGVLLAQYGASAALRRSANSFVRIFITMAVQGHGAALKEASAATRKAFQDAFEKNIDFRQRVAAVLQRRLYFALREHKRFGLTRRRADVFLKLAAGAALSEEEITRAGFDPFRCSEAYARKVELAAAPEFAAEALIFRDAIETIYEEVFHDGEIAVALSTVRLEFVGRVLADLTNIIDFREKYEDLTDDQVRLRPSLLLLARHGVLPFEDAGGALADLLAWANKPGRVAGRLYTGAGGVGKTRLALEACVRLRERGWIAGFLGRDALGNDLAQKAVGALLSRADGHVLLVVDYAETRPFHIETLVKIVEAHARHGDVRLICISRSGGAWWRRVAYPGSSVAKYFAAEAVDQVDVPLAEADRLSIYRSASEAFVKRLNQARMAMAAPNDIDPARLVGLDRPLQVAVAALLDIVGAPVQGQAASSRSPLADLSLVEREYWNRALGASADEPSRRAADRLASAATLAQGLGSRQKALNVAEVFKTRAVFSPLERDKAEEKVLDALVSLYPHQASKDAIGPIEPDMIGEHIVGERLADDDGEQWLLAVWDAVRDEDQRGDILTVLNRATRNEHARSGVQQNAQKALGWLAPKAVASASALATACLDDQTGGIRPIMQLQLEQAPQDELEALWAVVRVRYERDDRFAAFVQSVLRSRFGAAPEWPAELTAKELKIREVGRDLSAEEEVRVQISQQRQHESGKYRRRSGYVRQRRQDYEWRSSLEVEESLYDLTDAYAHSSKGDAQIGELIRQYESLVRQAESYRELGVTAQALSTAGTIVNVARELAHREPRQYRPYLAQALQNYANRLGALEKYEAALLAGQEAVDLLRASTNDNPLRDTRELGRALLNLGLVQSAIGDKNAAVSSVVESIGLFRRCVEAGQAECRSELANGLNTISVIRVDLGDLQNAARAGEEALDLRRMIAVEDPYANVTDVASSLNNLAVLYVQQGELGRAVGLAEEAVSVYRRLAQSGADEFRTAWINAQLNLTRVYAQHGDLERALKGISDSLSAVTIESDPLLWASLQLEYGRLSILSGNRDEALHHITNSLTVYSELDYPEFWAGATLELASLRIAFPDITGGADPALLDAVERALVIGEEHKLTWRARAADLIEQLRTILNRR